MGQPQDIATETSPGPNHGIATEPESDAMDVKSHALADVRSADNDGMNIQRGELMQQSAVDSDAAAVSKVEGISAVWGTWGKYSFFFGFALMMIIFELDNSTVLSYATYATSSYSELSMLGTLTTAGAIVAAILKPPVAKLSTIVGRAETYTFTITLYVISYILCASSAHFNTYAGGYICYVAGQTGTSILNSITISDFSSMRWRGFAYNFIYLPFLITPWVAGLIVDRVVNGIGWRWGYGMFAILMPACASWLIVTLFYLQRKARRAGLLLTRRLTLARFVSQIDLGGMLLLCGSFALILLPIDLASSTTSRWGTPWTPALIVVGVVLLACLYPYERLVARHPIVPPKYFTNRIIFIAFGLGCLDNIGFSATHTYLYAWSLVAHNLTPQTALYLAYVNGTTQCLTGILVGLVMYKTREYKWLGVAGAVIRMIGYGVMIHVRTADSSVAELFVVQAVQGVGSGIIETINIVAAQIAVPHGGLAQVTSLISLAAYLGGAIGAAIAGGIYTGTLRERLAIRLGPHTSPQATNELYDSISGTLPIWGSVQRLAVNAAFSDVMGYITIAALALSAPLVVLALFMPNHRLGDGKNLFAPHHQDNAPASEVLPTAELLATSNSRRAKLS